MTGRRVPRHLPREVAVCAVAIVAVALLACGSSSSPTRRFLLGVGPTWRHQPAASEADFVDMFQKVKGAGEALAAQGPWRNTPESAGATIPDPVALYLDQAGTYGWEPVVALQFFTEKDGAVTVDLAMPSPQDTTNAWSNADARSAFARTAFRILEAYHPRYLGLGIEVNTYWERDPEDYQRYAAWYEDTYAAIKADPRYGDTLVFATFQLEKLKRKGLTGAEDWTPFARLAGALDLAAFTTYPELLHADPADLPDDYYAAIPARMAVEIPLAFTEVGWSAAAPAQEAVQAEFVDRFFALTASLDRELVTWAFLHDVAEPGPLTRIGLYTNDGDPKAALARWQAQRAVPLRR